MKRHSSSQSLMAAGFLILAVIVAVFIWQPIRTQVNDLSEELEGRNLALEQLQSELAHLQSVSVNLPVAETERTRILKAVPLGFNQDNLVNDLDALAKRVNIDLNAMSFSQPSVHESFQSIAITANFTGRYSDLLALLEALETNSRLLKVASIGVQLSEVNDEGEQLMNFSVTLEAYYQ